MQCPRCGNSIAGGAAFCPNCGQFLAAAAGPGGQAVPMPDTRSNSTLWAVLGTVLVVLALLLGLRAAGILQFGSKNGNNPGLTAQGSAPGDTLGLRGSPPPAGLPQKQATMPDDVRRYLEHVERIEKKKIDLSLKMVSELEVFKTKLGTFGGAEGLMNHDEDLGGDGKRPDAETQGAVSDLRAPWDDLVREFKSVDPPPSCVGLRDDFYRALSEIPGMAGDIKDVLNMVTTDPAGALQKARGMQGSSSNAIDKYFGQADSDLGQICSIYSTAKWFEIKRDVAGGSLSMGGL